MKYSIEMDWDYAYLVYSTDNGNTWNRIETNLSTTSNPYNQNKGYGITGSSGDWIDMTASLPEGNVLLGFNYWTDANTNGFGFMVDDINVSGYALMVLKQIWAGHTSRSQGSKHELVQRLSTTITIILQSIGRIRI